MFELGAIDDLVVPRPRSTTGRALASMSLRRTFEACKALDPDRFDGDARAAALTLRHAFERRLPGDPHGIAHALAEPEIGVPVRAALRDPSLLPEAIERLLIRLGDREGRIDGEELAVFGRIRIRSGDPLLARCAGIVAAPGAPIDALRTAIERLRTTRPALHDDLRRFASVLLVTETASLAPIAIGVGTVPADEDPDRQFESLVGSIVRGKILALVEARPHDAEARERLIHEARAIALTASTPLGGADPSIAVEPPSDPLRFVADELRRHTSR